MSFILNFQSCTWPVTTWRIELLQVHHDVSVPPGTVLWEAGQPRTSADFSWTAPSRGCGVEDVEVESPIWKVIRPHFGGLTSHFTSYKSRSCSLHKFYDRFEWVIFWFKSVSVSLFLFLFLSFFSFLFYSILFFLSFFFFFLSLSLWVSPSLNQSI